MRQSKKDALSAARGFFRPEFLNRLDDIILFNRLTMADMARIVDIQIAFLKTRLAQKNIHLNCSHKALEWLGREGFDEVYGARELKRIIQKHLQNPIAEMILKGEFGKADELIVDVKNNQLVLHAQNSNRQGSNRQGSNKRAA